MAFVKVVEGSEIYYFPIHHFVHFYSKFWSFTCSNRGTAKQNRVSRCRDVAPVHTAPARLVTSASTPVPCYPRPHTDRGRALSSCSRAPRRLGTRTPHVSPPSRRTCVVHAADRRSVRDPSRTRAGRGAPYHGGIFAVDVMRT
jgi:hypothetical protein